MVDSRKIVDVRILPPLEFGEQAQVLVRLSGWGGSDKEAPLFSYFDDEVTFTRAELLGLTVAQAHELRHQKDLAWLQS